MSKAGGRVIIHEDECKGCSLCVHACPVHGLEIATTRLNRIGYHPVQFLDCGCTGCGVCFYACPEPGALHVVRLRPTGGTHHEAIVGDRVLPAGAEGNGGSRSAPTPKGDGAERART